MPQETALKVANRPATMKHHARCEVGGTLRGGRCELPGEIVFGGALLCAGHAEQARIRDRIDLLRGIVLCLGLSSRSVHLRGGDGNLASMVRSERARATRELELAYEDLRRCENECP